MNGSEQALRPRGGGRSQSRSGDDPPLSSFEVEIDRTSEAEWSSLLDEFGDASIYQTWAYGAVTWGDEQLSHLVLRRDGDPAALAQVRLVRVPALGCGVAYVRWGPVCTPAGSDCDPFVWRGAIRALVDEYVQRRGLTLRVLPFVYRQDVHAESVSLASHEIGLVECAAVVPYQTIRVDLRPPLEQLRARLAHKWRNQLNAAERNGLEVREGTDSALWDQFRVLYSEMMDRKHFDTTVNVDDFAKMLERLPASQKMLVLLGTKDGRPLSAVVASATGRTGIYLLGATGNDGLKAKASYLLQWRAMRRLKELGCEWYDLGGINADANPGVYHFKKGMGGDEVSLLGRYQLDGSLASRVALGAAERFGNRLRRGRQDASR